MWQKIAKRTPFATETNSSPANSNKTYRLLRKNWNVDKKQIRTPLFHQFSQMAKVWASLNAELRELHRSDAECIFISRFSIFRRV